MIPNSIIDIALRNSVVSRGKLEFLWNSVMQSPEGAAVEVGCWKGGSSLTIARALKTKSPQSRFFICDTFKGVALVTSKDNQAKNGDFGDTSRDHVHELLQSQELSNYTILEGIFPYDTSHLLPPNIKISFLHIDVDTYEGYKAILEWAQDKLVPESIIVFDDYGHSGCQGVTLAVNEYFEGRTDFEVNLYMNNDKSSWARFTGN